MPTAIPASCLTCGAMVRPGDRFCWQCGAVIRPAPTLPSGDPAAPQTPPEPTPRSPIPGRSSASRTGSTQWGERAAGGPGDTGRVPPPPPAAAQRPAGDGSRLWASAAPLSVLLGVPCTIGLASYVVPLLVWQGRKDADPFASNHGRQALNFVLSMTFYAIVFVILAIVTVGVGLLVAVPGLIGIAVAWLWFSVVGTIKSLNGESYDYPMTISFFKA